MPLLYLELTLLLLLLLILFILLLILFILLLILFAGLLRPSVAPKSASVGASNDSSGACIVGRACRGQGSDGEARARECAEVKCMGHPSRGEIDMALLLQ